MLSSSSIVRNSRITSFCVELDTDKRVFGYPFIGQCQIGNFLQTFHITDNGILLTFLFRLQIKFKGTYQLTVDFRQRQIILSVFLSDKFGKIALAAFITANGNQGVVFPDQGTALVIVLLHGTDEGADRFRFFVLSEKYFLQQTCRYRLVLSSVHKRSDVTWFSHFRCRHSGRMICVFCLWRIP